MPFYNKIIFKVFFIISYTFLLSKSFSMQVYCKNYFQYIFMVK